MQPLDCKLAATLTATPPGLWRIERAGQVQTISIAGSASRLDWAQNLLPLLHEHKVLGSVHAGFLTGALTIFDDVAGYLGAGWQFRIVGHSRGGALACLLAGLLKGSGEVVDCVVTLGAPRAGTDTLRKYLADIPIRQYRCGDDPIPLWPDPPFVHAREPLLQIGMPLHPLGDHALSRYLEALNAPDDAATDRLRRRALAG